jgi:pimeloyl-ACP methyl ester carboxylesterase
LTRLAKTPQWWKSDHCKNLLIIMMVAAMGIAMASGMGHASSPVPLNTPGIYSATADDGGTIYLYRYAPHTNKTPEFRTRGTPVVIFTGIMVNMNQFLSCTPADMKEAYENVNIPPVSSAPAWTLNTGKTDYEASIKADKMRYYSLAHYLWLQGYDPWLVNYRDTGRTPIHSAGNNDRSLNTLDTWAALDAPAAIAMVKEITGKRMFIGGHSTGGLVAYAYLQGAYLDCGNVATAWLKRASFKSRFALGYHPHVKSSADLAKTRNADIKGFIGIDPAGVPWLPGFLDSTIFRMMAGSQFFLPLDFISDKFIRPLPSTLVCTSTDMFFGFINALASDDVDDPNLFNYMNFWLAENMDPLMGDWFVRYGVSGASVRSLGQYMDLGLKNVIREHYLNGEENFIPAKWMKGGPAPHPGNDGYYYYSENMSRMTVPMIVFSSITGALVSPQATDEFIISKKAPTAYDQWYVISGTAHVDIVMGKKAPTVLFPRLGAWLKTVDALPGNPTNTTTPALRIDR